VFPDRPADLCDPRCELPLRCADLVDVAGLEKEELDEFVDREEVWRERVSVSLVDDESHVIATLLDWKL
jgi:hypothetical protein